MISWLEDIVKWTPFYYTSIVIVLLIILTYFFLPTISVVLFFALVGLWSRIPAMFNSYVKDLEMIDFLSVIIVLNINVFAGAFFAGGLIVFSHFFTKVEYPTYAIMDSISMFVAALATPFLYTYFGHNLLFTMYAYSAVRYLTRGVVRFIIGDLAATLHIGLINFGLAYLTNTIYVFVLGDFTTSLIKEGMHIHWGFLVIAVIILGFISSKKWMKKQVAKVEKSSISSQ